MKFLVDARLPFLDSCLSGESQSLLVETALWVLVYTIFANVFSSFLRSVSSRLPWWDFAKTRGGILCGNAQDDSVLLSILALHHGTAATMMVFGQLYNDPVMWRHGYLLETGFEIADLLALALHMYPYRHEGMKSDLKVALVFHHLPGISLAAFVLEAGLHYNEHMRAIGIWLLLGGCASCIFSLYIYSLSVETHMKQMAATLIASFAFFIYCRFYEFPKHSYYLIQDVQSSKEFEGTIILKLLYFGATALTLFNVGILADLLPKTIRYVKRAVDGVTPLEIEAVPKSREDRMKRRRSSLMMTMDTFKQARRRSSFETVLQVAETLVRVAEDDIIEEDLAALTASVAKFNKKTK
jgi:hypothetical protein